MKAWIGLGSNLEDSKNHLTQAMDELGQSPGIQVEARSRFYRSAPVGYLDQPDFINAVIRVDTTLTAEALLDILQAIENHHGRERSFQNAPRTLDLDLLLYGDQTLKTNRLELPHPRMHERAFVLLPLQELDPELMIPGQGRVKTLAQQTVHQDLSPL